MTQATVVSPRGAAPAPPKRGLASWFPWKGVVLPWLVSRLFSGGLIVVMSSVLNHKLSAAGFELWDGGWYLRIGTAGYHAPQLRGIGWAFFPVLPGIVHTLQLLGMGGGGGALVVNHVAFLLALAGLYELARRRVGDRAAGLAVWSLAMFPLAFVFSMLYPSSIFLALSVWAFLFVEDRHDWWAGILVAVAVLTRPNGFVLAAALGIGLVATRREWRRATVVCAPAVLAIGIWCTFLYHWTGDPIVFYTAKGVTNEWPEVTIVAFLKHFPHSTNVRPHLMLAIAAIGAVAIERKRLPWVWSLFTLLYLLPSFALGMVGLGRYANECFPPFVAAGALLERQGRAVRVLAFSAAVLGQWLCAYWIIVKDLVP
ncbi:MAG TPA: glycosyltransferase family 39 protein [Acidimicrobiia bacterium]